MNIKTLFFDLDGTLIDSRERLYRLFIHLAPNPTISFDEYWNYKMAKKSNEWILKNKFGIKENAAIESFTRNWMKKIESPQYLALDKLFPDTISVLDKLHNVVSMYIITARQHPSNLMLQLENLDLIKYFKSVLVTEQKNSKTDLIRSLDFPLNASAIIGDTGEETLVGKELGLITINVLTGFRNKAVLETYQPDFIYKDLTEFGKKIIENNK